MPDTSFDESPGYVVHIIDEQQHVVGTGFQVAPGLIITALHVVGPLALQDPESAVQVVPFAVNRPQPAVILAAAGHLDLALLACREPLGSSVGGFIPTRRLVRGTRVDILLASAAGRLTQIDGNWRGTRISADGVREGLLSTSDFEQLPGMSGAPVVHSRDNHIVGVLLGFAPDRVTGIGPTLRIVPSERVARFLDDVTRESRPAPPNEPRLLYEMGVVAWHTGDGRAAGLLERAAESFQSEGDLSSAAAAWRLLGGIANRGGDTDTAEQRCRQALALFQASGWARGEAACYEDLGWVALFRNDFQATRRHAGRALSLFEKIGDVYGTAEVHTLLGNASEGLGDLRDAEDRYQSARTLYDQAGDLARAASTCYDLGVLAYRRNDYDHAVRYSNEALTLFERADDPDRQAQSHALLGQLAEETERYPEARAHYEQALDLYQETGHTSGQATSLNLLSGVTYRQREFELSIRYLQDALYLFTNADNREGTAVTLGNLGVLAATMGESDRALEFLVRAMNFADPQRQQSAHLLSVLTTVRDQVGAKQFDDLLRSAVATSKHPEGERFLNRLRDALATSESGNKDIGASGGPDGPALTPPEPPGDHPSESRDDDDPQIINIWVDERANNPTLPLVARQRYTLLFRVGVPHPGNLAEGSREIPRDTIPRNGLTTNWVVSSTDVAISADPNDAYGIQVDMADSGGTAQWMASFQLTVPARGNSENRALAVVPLNEGQARIEVAVSIAGDLYRWLTVDLAVSPPNATPAVTLPVPTPTGTSESGQQQAITTTVAHGPPLRHVAPKPSADWQAPTNRLNITFQPPQAHLGSEQLGIDTMVRWAPNCAHVEAQIQRVREALDRLRLAQQDYFNGVDPAELARRLASYQPSPHWARRSVRGDRWTRIATCPHLRQLAQEGHVLYQLMFDAGSETRKTVDALQSGDMLSLTWFPTAQHVAHVPWALMYRDPPPARGQPIDPENFLGIRLRLRYVSHQMPYLNRSLGSQDSFTRAHLMYWGCSSDDPVAKEKERHLDELKQWEPFVLPTRAPGKPEVVDFLDNPAPNPVGIVYIYCRSMGGDQDGPGFRFGNGPREEDTVALSEIGVSDIPDRPLVFANACGTSAGSPYVPNELEERFFLRGCSAFIGTECKVPITFAARFATAFFHFLYADHGKPTPAGEALAQARRFFWSEYGIVGGLFYSYVNDYHLYVATDNAVAALSKLGQET